MMFRSAIAGQVAALLMDSTAGDCFIRDTFCQPLGLKHVVGHIPTTVHLGDGSPITGERRCLVDFCINGVKFQTTCLVIPLPPAFDVILGDPWLGLHGVDLSWRRSGLCM
jgi:hypothetical protein